MVFYNISESAIKMRLKRAKEKLLNAFDTFQCEATL